jgi:hypothetical protein
VFKLYKEQKDTFPFAHYATLLKEATGAKTALEFGPGISTLALIEAGVEKIVSLESDPEWAKQKAEEFKDYPQVTIGGYTDTVPVHTTGDVLGDFDLAIVDAPAGFTYAIPGRTPRKAHKEFPDCSRMNTCLFALDHAPIVYLHDATRPLERGTLGRLNQMGHRFEFIGRAGLAKIWRKPD